ncbi:MAG: hypothetical protein WCS59_01640 [Sphaerochaetaceae bacterium]|nr:hypothetical protein [Sphaerochaetaceae bacterium]
MKRGFEHNFPLYRVNPETQRVIIDIAIDRYVDYFHEWDNAVFRKRDLHPELAEFLDLCSEEIPLRKALEINFCIKNRPLDVEKEKTISASYRNFYQAQLRMTGRQIMRLIRFATVLFVVAFCFIAGYTVIDKSNIFQLFPQVLLEGLVIGGWVFMWESLHIIFFETLDPMKRRRELKRFLSAAISFRAPATSL